MSWAPLLAGDDAVRALAAARRIGDEIRDAPVAAGGGLARGDSGIGLVLAYLARVTGDRALADDAESRLQAGLEQAIESPGAPALWTGLAGAVFAAERGLELLGGELEEDPYGDIDQVLLEVVQQRGRSLPVELLAGLAGLGVYALWRPPAAAAPLLAQVVARLCERAEPRPGGLAWFTPPEHLHAEEVALFPGGIHSLGVAHGGPGVIALLAGAAQRGVAGAGDAAGAGLDWLWRQRLEGGSFAAVAERPVAHRAGWCYGDAGVAATLLVSGRALGEKRWIAAGLELAEAIARRDDCGIDDPSLCHGAFGLAHILNRAHQAGASGAVADCARLWLARGLAMNSSGAGLLDGAAGSAAALAAAASGVPPLWDAVFALSLPDHRQMSDGQKSP